MIIELPDSFERIESKNNFVRIRKGVLELKGHFKFEELMIELAYRMKGRNRCYYCRKQVNPKKITIDHLYPSDFGGVTITNNLEPACYICNSHKSNMNQYEFQIWRTLRDDDSKRGYYHRVVAKKKARKNSTKSKKGFDLPKAWISYRNLSAIKKISKIDNRGSEKFKRMLIFAKRYHKLPRPIVISSNYILLDGETAYAVARELRFQEVPVIILENVVVLR